MCAAGRAHRVIHTYAGNHAGYYPGAQSMILKLLVVAATDGILGAQGVGGGGGGEGFDVIATAMTGGIMMPLPCLPGWDGSRVDPLRVG